MKEALRPSALNSLNCSASGLIASVSSSRGSVIASSRVMAFMRVSIFASSLGLIYSSKIRIHPTVNGKMSLKRVYVL